jgi:hypothetical protein
MKNDATSILKNSDILDFDLTGKLNQYVQVQFRFTEVMLKKRLIGQWLQK